MRTIGVISDTHGLLREEALAALAGSDLILHAGDVGRVEILEALRRIAPVWAVRGNTDFGALASALPATQVVDLLAADGQPATRSGDAAAERGDAAAERDDAAAERDATESPRLLAYLLHDLEHLDLDPAAAGLRVVVYGHTHRPAVDTRGGVLYLNPGAAGHRRFRLPVTIARITVAGGKIDAQIVGLDVGE